MRSARLIPSGFRELSRIALDLLDGRHYVFHVLARPEQHGLRQPDCLGTEPVVSRAAITLVPLRDCFSAVNALKPAGLQRVLEQRLFVQWRISTRRRNAFSSERLEKLITAQPGKMR